MRWKCKIEYYFSFLWKFYKQQSIRPQFKNPGFCQPGVRNYPSFSWPSMVDCILWHQMTADVVALTSRCMTSRRVSKFKWKSYLLLLWPFVSCLPVGTLTMYPIVMYVKRLSSRLATNHNHRAQSAMFSTQIIDTQCTGAAELRHRAYMHYSHA